MSQLGYMVFPKKNIMRAPGWSIFPKPNSLGLKELKAAAGFKHATNFQQSIKHVAAKSTGKQRHQ